jgi:hypothetical protein
MVIESEDDLLAAATGDGGGGCWCFAQTLRALPKLSVPRMFNEFGSYSLLCATEW